MNIEIEQNEVEQVEQSAGAPLENNIGISEVLEQAVAEQAVAEQAVAEQAVAEQAVALEQVEQVVASLENNIDISEVLEQNGLEQAGAPLENNNDISEGDNDLEHEGLEQLGLGAEQNTISSNILALEENLPEVYSVVVSQDYGSKEVLTELVPGEVQKKIKVGVDINEDFDAIYDSKKLVDFFDKGLVKGKGNARDWVMIDRKGDIVEYMFGTVAGIQAHFPNMIKTKNKALYKTMLDCKQAHDNKYQNLRYEMTLGESRITKSGDTAVIKQEIRLKEGNERKLAEVAGMTPENVDKVEKMLEGTLVGYTDILIKAGVYRKFLGSLKKSLWHFVDEKDSGKTTWMEAIEANIEIYQEDNLSRVLGEKAKVDAPSLGRSILLHQDETTIMFNDFKLLTNDTLKLDLAYEKKQVKVDAPLVVMTSHDDVMETYSQQFQARVIKIYPSTGDIKVKLDALVAEGIGLEQIEAVTYVYVRNCIEEVLKGASEPGAAKVFWDEVSEFIETHKVKTHDPIEIVRTEIYNMLAEMAVDLDGNYGGGLPRKYEKYRFELGEKKNNAGVKSQILVVSGATAMKKGFLENLIEDKTIFYEITKDDYDKIGFEFFKTCSFDKGLRQNAWVLDLGRFNREVEAAQNSPDNTKITPKTYLVDVIEGIKTAQSELQKPPAPNL